MKNRKWTVWETFVEVSIARGLSACTTVHGMWWVAWWRSSDLAIQQLLLQASHTWAHKPHAPHDAKRHSAQSNPRYIRCSVRLGGIQIWNCEPVSHQVWYAYAYWSFCKCTKLNTHFQSHRIFKLANASDISTHVSVHMLCNHKCAMSWCVFNTPYNMFTYLQVHKVLRWRNPSCSSYGAPFHCSWAMGGNHYSTRRYGTNKFMNSHSPKPLHQCMSIFYPNYTFRACT